jgi:hypothetical protein
MMVTVNWPLTLVSRWPVPALSAGSWTAVPVDGSIRLGCWLKGWLQ